MPLIGMLRLLIVDKLRGTNILQELNRIDKEQYLSNEQLSKQSTLKTQQVIAYAKSHVPYYQQFSDDSELPVLTKDLIRAHNKEFLAPNFREKLYPKATGGSTGLPLHYYTTAKAQGFMWAGIFHAWRIVGYKLGDKVAFVSGTALVKNNWQHQFFYKLMNVEVLSAYDLSEPSIERYLKSLNEKKVKVIYGYPTALNEIALYLLKKDDHVFKYLKGIVTTSEILYDKHRVNIENAFKVVVRNQYGCNEAGISAFECEHGKLHLINTASSIELHNGDLYATNLVNDAFYFIKYFTGDSIVMSPSSCSCKRGYPVIEKVNGRSVDIIVDMNGKKIHSALFSILFRNETIVEQFQIQFDENTLDVYLKLSQSELPQDKHDKFIDLIKKQMSFNQYIIHYNSPFLLSANAKHKYVIDNRTRQNL
jgi:phenylacetate-CoA ligase